MYCTIVTSSKNTAIGNGLTYQAKKDEVQLGSHVRVSLRNQLLDGIVVKIEEDSEKDFSVKDIHSVVQLKPLLTKAQIQTLHWIAEYYCCTLRHALSAWIPSPPWDKLLPEEVLYYRLSNKDAVVRGSKQKKIIDVLSSCTQMESSALKEATGASTSTINSLIEQEIVSKNIEKIISEEHTSTMQRPELTDEQKAVYEEMKKEKRPTLLFGVTGSGKTEVYINLAIDAIEQGRQAIILVPEILLTEHTIHRFIQYFDRESISILHSRLTLSQKKKEWRRIRTGAVSLVIGSRSALYAPVNDLGVVVIDEEHEWTYKNEQMPRYHARDVARKLTEFSGAKLVLGSATPCVESWNHVKKEEFHMVRLDKRYMDAAFPDVKVIDLAEVKFGSLYPFSPTLLEAIADRITKKEQSILFINRRGIATSMLCLDCKRRIVSPDSNLPFTLHRDHAGAPYLMDHTTDLKVGVPDICPNCQSARLQAIGAGTQGIEDILKRQFPTANLLRADKETLSHPDSMKELLHKMRSGQADILLGTQSVVKGLDIEGVTLAAVLLADVGLSLPHFRAGERIFQLLTQLTGRSGRHKPGEVIIQTFRPDAPEVQYAANHEAAAYLDTELQLRTYLKYPPSSGMIKCIFRGPDARDRAKKLHNYLEITSAKHKSDTIISSSAAFFGGGNVWHVFMRGSNPRADLEATETLGAIIDIDPIECV